MLTVEKISKLRKFLKCVGQLECQQEEIRFRLCSLPNFNPLFVMKLLDKEDKGYITKYDIQRFLGIQSNKKKSFPDSKYGLLKARLTTEEEEMEEIVPKDIDIMMKYFDLDNDGCLNYEEMMFVLLPCTDDSIIAQIKKNK